MAFLDKIGVERLWNHILIKLNNKVDKNHAATDDDIIELLVSMDMMPVITDADGNIMTDENDAILLV